MGDDSPADAGSPYQNYTAGTGFSKRSGQAGTATAKPTAATPSTGRKSGLGSQSFLLSNIQRLITPSGRTKSGFLSDQAQLSGALLVAVTETWLSSQILDREVCHNFSGYSLLRCDREGRHGEELAYM